MFPWSDSMPLSSSELSVVLSLAMVGAMAVLVTAVVLFWLIPQEWRGKVALAVIAGVFVIVAILSGFSVHGILEIVGWGRAGIEAVRHRFGTP
jgi:hypothetical protein